MLDCTCFGNTANECDNGECGHNGSGTIVGTVGRLFVFGMAFLAAVLQFTISKLYS